MLNARSKGILDLFYRLLSSKVEASDLAGVLSETNLPSRVTADIDTTRLVDGSVTVAKLSADVLSTFLPSGAILPFAMAAAPTGWLSADGSAVSRTTYADLFAVIGTTYGAGDGTTTFLLPNLKGRVIAGIDATQTEFDALGETGGAKTHTLLTTEIPAHTHPIALHGDGTDAVVKRGDVGAPSGQIANTNANTAAGGAHNNLQPYIVLTYCIKT